MAAVNGQIKGKSTTVEGIRLLAAEHTTFFLYQPSLRSLKVHR